MELLSTSVAETKKFAREFLKTISETAPPRSSDGDAGGAVVVGLYGNLGSGKTTFVQCLAEALGVREHITSPTFVIMKSYKLTANSYKFLVHIDAYRLKNGEELRKLGFEELLHDPTNLILIEWADRVADVLPSDHTKLTFEFVDEKTRKVTFDK